MRDPAFQQPGQREGSRRIVGSSVGEDRFVADIDVLEHVRVRACDAQIGWKSLPTATSYDAQLDYRAPHLLHLPPFLLTALVITF